MIIKRFGIDFKSEYGALTLNAGEVADSKLPECPTGTQTCTHPDGWTITGEIHEDYYSWVNAFEAAHPTFGKVWGDFESEVSADSEEGFAHFYAHHPPEAWDYADI